MNIAEQSRRDDLESLGYILLYFICGGRLPWMGLHETATDKKHDRPFAAVHRVKLSTSVEELCRLAPRMTPVFFECVVL